MWPGANLQLERFKKKKRGGIGLGTVASEVMLKLSDYDYYLDFCCPEDFSGDCMHFNPAGVILLKNPQNTGNCRPYFKYSHAFEFQAESFLMDSTS